MTPYLVEEVKVRLHLRREKIEPSILFSRRGYEMVLLKGADVMLCNPIMNVKSFRKLVDIVGFPS